MKYKSILVRRGRIFSLYLRSDRAIILGVALHGEVEDGLLMLVL